MHEVKSELLKPLKVITKMELSILATNAVVSVSSCCCCFDSSSSGVVLK